LGLKEGIPFVNEPLCKQGEIAGWDQKKQVLKGLHVGMLVVDNGVDMVNQKWPRLPCLDVGKGVMEKFFRVRGLWKERNPKDHGDPMGSRTLARGTLTSASSTGASTVDIQGATSARS
jgi:hypothetical protein